MNSSDLRRVHAKSQTVTFPAVVRCGGRGQTPRPGCWEQNIHRSFVHCSLRPHLSSTSSSNLPFEPVEVCETSPSHRTRRSWGCAPPRAARVARCSCNKTIAPAPRRARRGSGPAPPRAARVAGGDRTSFFYQPLLGAGASPNTRRTRRSWGCASHQSSTTPTGGHAISFFFLTVQPSHFPAPVLTPCAS